MAPDLELGRGGERCRRRYVDGEGRRRWNVARDPVLWPASLDVVRSPEQRLAGEMGKRGGHGVESESGMGL